MPDQLTQDLTNKTEAAMKSLPEVECPLVHLFTPGLYTREITIPAGTVAASRVHKTDHPFAVMRGTVAVINGESHELLHAPHMGVTTVGTRRLLYAVTDVVWVTFHANPDNIDDPDQMVELLTDLPDNPHVDYDDPRFNIWRSTQTPSIIHRRKEP